MAAAKERGRARLDSSLMSPALSQRAGIVQIVRDQLSASPALDKHYHAWSQETIDKVAEKRATEISTFLDALRSARQELLDNEDTPFSWKIKEETDVMRVMYRPGPEGMPFHTYCVEGIVNGPMMNAICVAWEAPAFYTWWPQFNMPTFKVVESKWVKRIRVGEDLCHIRVKVPWPLAQREVLMTEFELEYFEDDVVIVTFGTAPSDPDEGEEEIYGFSADELPPATQDVVRMEVSGGFMLQKMTNEQSFFRTLVNMDIKLDFVPPWVINFITRQLVGSGYKLYQKAVLSASQHKVFQKLMASEPLYHRIKDGMKRSEKKQMETKRITADTATDKIEEVKEAASTSQELVERFRAEKLQAPDRQEVIHIDSEVERALQVLDKIIELVEDMKSQTTSSDPFPPAATASMSALENGDVAKSSLPKNAKKNLASDTSCFGSGRRPLLQATRQQTSKLALLKDILKGKFKGRDGISPMDLDLDGGFNKLASFNIDLERGPVFLLYRGKLPADLSGLGSRNDKSADTGSKTKERPSSKFLRILQYLIALLEISLLISPADPRLKKAKGTEGRRRDGAVGAHSGDGVLPWAQAHLSPGTEDPEKGPAQERAPPVFRAEADAVCI
ncbi:hypothetical protein SELMODRAFT_438663 [Selaginella moellendorffii]|uniref:START domain-containing protein n=1 Tax=Selaginella moellendorffii TaxID=88036 RepID=D8QYL8_SELML|nr:hypothetical protein SELMODRAFT_438663 [Selaginella moellendorffii]